MLCEVCGKNEATIHVTKIINGDKQELNICKACAEKMGDFNIGSDIEMISPFSFQNILSGLMDYVNHSAQNKTEVDLKCQNCGTTYREFKEKGMFGCSECYSSFNTTIMNVIKGVQGNTTHIGKLPKSSGEAIIKRKKMLGLKEELQKAIYLEEYERAAEIRDEIRDIENAEIRDVENNE